MFHSFLNSLARSKDLSLFSISWIFCMSAERAKIHNTQVPFYFFFVVNYLLVWFSGRGFMICLYFKIPENFMRFILRDGFWFLRVPFRSLVKFHILAQFLTDHLPCPVMSRLILLLCYYYYYYFASFVRLLCLLRHFFFLSSSHINL